jgi:hypothetical protein
MGVKNIAIWINKMICSICEDKFNKVKADVELYENGRLKLESTPFLAGAGFLEKMLLRNLIKCLV